MKPAFQAHSLIPISYTHGADAGSLPKLNAQFISRVTQNRGTVKHSLTLQPSRNKSLNSLGKDELPAPIASLLTISSTFDSLFKVLFIFPSRYLFAIGLSLTIFSLGWDLPPA